MTDKPTKHSYKQRGILTRILKVRYEVLMPSIIKHDNTRNEYVKIVRTLHKEDEEWMLKQLYFNVNKWVTRDVNGGTVMF